MVYNVSEHNYCSIGQTASNSELSDHLPTMPDWFLIDQCDSDNVVDFLDGIYAYNKYIIDTGLPSFMKEPYLPLNLPTTPLDIDLSSFKIERYPIPKKKKFKGFWRPKHLVSPVLVQSGRNDLGDHVETKHKHIKHVSFRDVLNSNLKPEQILRTTPAPTPLVSLVSIKL